MRGESDVEVEKAVLANAWIWPDFPGLVTLLDC